MQLGTTLSGEVQLVREDYSLVTLPNFSQASGFVALQGCNLRQSEHKHVLFSKLDLRVEELPSEQNGKICISLLLWKTDV